MYTFMSTMEAERRTYVKWISIVTLTIMILYSSFFLENADSRLTIITPMACPTPKISSSDRPYMALASFPGSGNTWTRHLIETSTGLCTGAEYCGKILNLTFICECSRIGDRRVLIMKTHRYYKKTILNYKKAIILIRNPYDAVVAEFNRQSKGQLGIASKATYDEKFKKKAAHLMKYWYDFHLSWHQFNGQKFILQYEKLKSNTTSEIRKVVDFLNVSVPETNFKCLKNNIEGLFHRKKNNSLRVEPLRYIEEDTKKIWNSNIHKIEQLYGLNIL